jgi:hypothetical protein
MMTTAAAAILAAVLVLAMPYSSADEILAGNVGTASPVSGKWHDATTAECDAALIWRRAVACIE